MKNIEKYRDEYIAALKENAPCEFRRKYVLNREFCHGYEFVCEGCAEKLARWLDSECIPQIDWSKVPVDTPVICHRSKDYNSTLKRHVKRVSNDSVITFNNGMTSHTATDCTGTTCWDVGLVELARPEDIKKYSI